MIEYQAVRANPKLLEQKRPGEHVWMTIATWVVSGDTLMAAQRGEKAVMHWDAENLAGFHTGCYICEQEFTERLYHRKCTGEPRP
jgi:hypothetical protein